MTRFRECPELQLGSRDKSKTHPAEKQHDTIYELALQTRTLPGKEASVVRNHRAFVQHGRACSRTNRELLHKYYAEIATVQTGG